MIPTKRLLALLAAAVMLLSLAACSSGNEKPSGDIGDIGSGGAQSGEEGAGKSDGDSDVLAPGETRVETKNDRIVTTADDGLGNISVTEYIYKDGALTEIILTMRCADAAAAKSLIDSYSSGDLKEYAAQLYSDMRQDGSNAVFTFNEGHISAFAGFTMEQLAAMLGGGDPFSAGGEANDGAL